MLLIPFITYTTGHYSMLTLLGDASETASYVSGASVSSGMGSLLVFEFQESGITRHIAVDTTLDKPPKFRNATKLHIANDHVFVATSIKRYVHPYHL